MKQDAGTRQLWELTLLHLQVRVVVVALYHSLFHLNGVGEVLEEVVVIADGGALTQHLAHLRIRGKWAHTTVGAADFFAVASASDIESC